MSETEQAVEEAFAAGTELDLTGRQDRVVRAGVLRRLLLGGGAPAEAGTLPALRLIGAQVTGALEVEYADVTASIELQQCTFDALVSFFGSRLRRLGLEGSHMPALMAASATFDATVRLTKCRVDGDVILGLSQVNGSLLMSGAELGGFSGSAMRVSGDILADREFACASELRLNRAEVAGTVWLQPALPLRSVDLSHARIGQLRDDPTALPMALRLDGLACDTPPDPDDVAARLPWLELDPRGFRPHAYHQLAQIYRAAGKDDDARTILLEGERRRHSGLGLPGRWLGRLLDVTVGYGYRPGRAVGWLAVLLVAGSAVFGWYPPRPVDPGRAPDFVAPVYTLDLILPVVDFGQQQAFHPRGASVWLAYALTVAGLVLVTTIGAAVARRLRRD